MDKTGTLTEGKPKLVTIVTAPRFDEASLLRFAATLERGSEHPLAAAIVEGGEERGAVAGSASGFEAIPGKGVRGTVDGRAVALGNQALMTGLGVDFGPFAQKADALRAAGETVMFVAVDGRPGACSASPIP